jgi:hypothetical protein
MPVLVWGNGACSTDGRSNSALLQNIASYGFLAIAEGGPNGGGSSNKDTMRAAIDWVTKTAGTGAYANVDATKIMAAGFSCGGVEAIDNIWDSRVDTVGVISSGLLSNQTAAKDWKKPVLFVLGGSGDIAYANVSPPFSMLPPTKASEMLNLRPGRARLQEPRGWCSFVEGQHSRWTRRYSGRCQWRDFRQGHPQLDALDHEGRHKSCDLLHHWVPG